MSLPCCFVVVPTACLQLVVDIIGDGLKPLVAGTVLNVGVECQMLHPRVAGGSVPVLGLGRDGDHSAGAQFDSGLAPLLIPAAASHTDQHLHLLVVDVPVVAAAWLEGHVDRSAMLGIKRSKIAVADEVLRRGRVGLTLGPDAEVHCLDGGS